MTDERATKLTKLTHDLQSYSSAAVAFSAGVDSTLLLKLAIDALGADNVTAITARSDSIPQEELSQAKALAESMGVRHIVLDTDEFEDEAFIANPANRCYVCRNHLFGRMRQFAGAHGIAVILAGNNADDTSDFRPGMQAAREHGVVSPLMDAGLTKEDIRALSEQLGLPTCDKPASPCLATRIPYGQRITTEKLRMIEAAETYLHKLGHTVCRVRAHENLARIEVLPTAIAKLCQPETAKGIHEHFESLGFQYVALDLRGFRSGSLNEAISKTRPA